jgi:hypothetical protein
MTIRTLNPTGLVAELLAAQAAFAARGAGEAETWLLPEGNFAVDASLVLGAEDKILTLRGAGAGTELRLGAGARLGLVGARLRVEGLRLRATGGGASALLEARAVLALRLSGVTVEGLAAAAGDVTGLVLAAPDLRLTDVSVRDLSAPGGRATGMALRAAGRLVADRLTFGRLGGAEVLGLAAEGGSEVTLSALTISGLAAGGAATGARVSGGTLVLDGVTLADVTAGGPALGLDLAAGRAANITGIDIDRLEGAGLPGRPFADLAGDGAAGLRLTTPAGRLADARIGTLVAASGRDVPLRLPEGFAVDGVSVARAIDGADLTAALASAQAALAESHAGVSADWTLPPGDFQMTAPLALGAPGRNLSLRGADVRLGGTRLSFEAQGGGPLQGDATALGVVGGTVGLAAVSLSARATGSLTLLSVAAETSARLESLAIGACRGTTVIGALIAAPLAELMDLTATDLRATNGDAVAVRLTGADAALSDLRLAGVTATGAATGLALTVTAGARVAATRIDGVRGLAATGVLVRVDGAAPGIAAVLDLRVTGIEARAGGDLALGAGFLCRGDVELRAVGAVGVAGERALGALVAATGSIDWLAGELSDIQGRSAGASAARICAAPQPARDDGTPGTALRDIVIEAVRGGGPANRPQPADSWLAAGPDLAEALVANGLAALPGPGTAGHLTEVTGLSVTAPVSDFADWIGGRDPGSVAVESCILHRITGTALQIDAALRDLSLRGTELWTATDAAWIDAERVLIANVTAHRMARGFSCATSEVTVANSLFTATDAGPGLAVAPGGTLHGGASWATLGSAPLAPEPAPLPYVLAGPATPVPASFITGTLTPAAPVDLALRPESLALFPAMPVPGDPPGAAVHVGATPPLASGHCAFVDPDPPPAPAPPPVAEPSPFTDYLSRDARTFLTIMLDRAATVMTEWTTRTPGDFTTMLLETLAHEIDVAAYRQEEAVANGYLSTATLWRALEDHARLVDHLPDRGHSATAMLRFDVSDPESLGLAAEFAAGGTLEIPPGTLVVNPDADALSLVFATEAPLVYDPLVAGLTLAEDSVIAQGGLTALVRGDLAARLAGRWLVIEGTGPDGEDLPRHVVRVVTAQEGIDATLIAWDPRRPAPTVYAAARTVLRGNVLPAHHGVPLAPAVPGAAPLEDPLAPWREMLAFDVPAPRGRLAEVALPVGPVSLQRRGWPFPGETQGIGVPQIAATLDGLPLALDEDLSADPDGAPVMALRPTREGGPGVAIVGAEGGGRMEIALSVGLGATGNVGRGALTRVLLFGEGAALAAVLPGRADRLDLLKAAIQVTNDLPAVGGRDPASLETIRAQAPLANRRTLSAVAPRDYERLLEELDEVAAARATVVDTGLGRTIRITALMTGEDTLGLDELGPAREAERLRRWALARRRLADIRLMGFDVELVPPDFVPLDIDLAVDVAAWASADAVRRAVEAALRDDGGLFDPDRSGLGRDVTADAIQRTVLSVAGVEAARLLRLRRLTPGAQDYARAPQMPIGATEVAVLAQPYGGPDGALTVTTCGGLA